MSGCLQGWCVLLLAGLGLPHFQVEPERRQRLEKGLEEILDRLKQDMSQGVTAKDAVWTSKKLSVDPSETFLLKSPDKAALSPFHYNRSEGFSQKKRGEKQHSPKGSSIGLWSKIPNDKNPVDVVPAQLPHRVKRGTGMQQKNGK